MTLYNRHMSLTHHLIPLSISKEEKAEDPNPIRSALFQRLHFRYPRTPSTADTFRSYAAAKTTVTFTANHYAQIYRFPTPTVSRVFAVISLGGGLYGSVKNGILTGGDVQKYWTQLGIKSQPVVYIQSVDRARNFPRRNDDGATIENTIDVATIGAACPGNRHIIILYIAPRTFNGFYNAFNAAINGRVTVNGASVRPSIISCSWGAPEKYWAPADLTRFNTLFGVAVANGVNITAASGDYGASNGLPGLNTDFPSSSPNVIACGGTTLVCPTKTYTDASTRETTWRGSGGGISEFFAKPAYQSSVAGTKRNTPDVAMVADPNTGVAFIVGGKTMVVGGTSLVSPALAAYIGCLAKSPGFIAPLLYTNPTCFNDILLGTNDGYTAKVGYDNCTGLGSINGVALTPRI